MRHLSSLPKLIVRHRSKSRMKVAVGLCMTVAALLTSVETWPAEEQTEEQANSQKSSESSESTTDEQVAADKSKAAARKREKAKDKEIFRPSEEISEDFAVSFPVDI